MTILGIDYGRTHVGLATGESDLHLALPLKTYSGLAESALIKELEKLVQELHIEKIIVGAPKSLQADEAGTLELEVKNFADMLHTSLQIPVELVDERFSSDAAQRLRQEGSRADDHQLAAMVVLQTYLDRQP